MDQIPLPKGAFHAHARVPFIAYDIHAYDGLGFCDFPTRKGLGDLIHSGVFQEWDQEDVARFIRAWCFFRILIEVFKFVGVGFDVDDLLTSMMRRVCAC